MWTVKAEDGGKLREPNATVLWLFLIGTYLKS